MIEVDYSAESVTRNPALTVWIPNRPPSPHIYSGVQVTDYGSLQNDNPSNHVIENNLNIDNLDRENLDLDNHCPICFELVDLTTSRCTTSCGHLFCLSCMIRTININKTCPICRNVLEIKDEEDANKEDEDSGSVEGSDEGSGEGSGEGLNLEDTPPRSHTVRNVETLAEQLISNGITMVDILSMYIGRYPHSDKYTNVYIYQLTDLIHQIIDQEDNDAEKEYHERIAFASEDHNALLIVPLESDA